MLTLKLRLCDSKVITAFFLVVRRSTFDASVHGLTAAQLNIDSNSSKLRCNSENSAHLEISVKKNFKIWGFLWNKFDF